MPEWKSSPPPQKTMFIEFQPSFQGKLSGKRQKIVNQCPNGSPPRGSKNVPPGWTFIRRGYLPLEIVSPLPQGSCQRAWDVHRGCPCFHRTCQSSSYKGLICELSGAQGQSCQVTRPNPGGGVQFYEFTILHFYVYNEIFISKHSTRHLFPVPVVPSSAFRAPHNCVSSMCYVLFWPSTPHSIWDPTGSELSPSRIGIVLIWTNTKHHFTQKY